MQYVKSTVNSMKTGIVKRFNDLNNANIRSLGSLSTKIQGMMKTSNEITESLNNALQRQIENTGKLQKIITGMTRFMKNFSNPGENLWKASRV